MPSNSVNINYSSSTYSSALYQDLCRAEGYNHQYYEDWYTTTSPYVPEVIYYSGGVSSYVAIFALDDVLVQANGTHNHVHFTVSSTDLAKCQTVMPKLRQLWPPTEHKDPGLIPVTFWSRGSDGRPQSVQRDIDVPAWTDISANYPSDVRTELDYLIHTYEANPQGGKLILWTGVPGTGKTFALRSLAREWGDWCDLHYIIDPDSFFTGSADYLFQVALDDSTLYPWDKDGDEHKSPKWRLIVCEDTGELLSADAKDRTGTALARFLNMCDGIIGQGLRIQILITTNEDIKNFHPAVTRPGRAASQIAFTSFSRQEASQWLERDPLDLPKNHYTLAQLYALSRGESTEIKVGRQQPTGFVPSSV